jgi:hypothetical protein
MSPFCRLEWLRRLLRKPIFGTRVIPKDASVDPSLFPEDEYPVACPKCWYSLHQLPDGRCPECGTAFQRGRLLVRLYVTGWKPIGWTRRPIVRWTLVVFAFGFAFYLLGMVGLLTIKLKWTPNSVSPSFAAAAMTRQAYSTFAAVGAMLLGMVLFVVSCVMTKWWYSAGMRRKRRAVLAALYDSTIQSDS